MNKEIKTEESAVSEEVLLPPSDEQLESIDFLINAVENREPVVGFIAPGGCGKTFTMKHFSKDPRLSGIEVTFTATTNKAAAVMKAEGIDGAKTLHSAISKHIPTKMYQNMELLFAKKSEFYDDQENSDEEFMIEFPSDVRYFLEDINVKEEAFFDYKNEKELLAENKISSFDNRIFSHYAIADYQGGVISIDEASMLPNKSKYHKDNEDGEDGKLKLKVIGLDLVTKVYDTAILVGDDSQLPPISGSSSFDDIPKTTVTKNFRSDKGLLRVLDYVRGGGNIADFVPIEGENVRILASATAEYFVRDDLIENKVTHIVFKNKTRKSITQQIRFDLTNEPIANEPIVYKGANIDNPPFSSISKNETGVFNGMMGEWENHTQVVQGRNFDEYGDGFTYLQYAYAITAHTAQGSKFDYVVIHNDDVPHFIDSETKRKWLYTAVSRAVKGIIVIY